MCESFGCTPSQAEAEMERDPQLVIDVMEMRAYVTVREAWLAAGTGEGPKGPMADWVEDIEVEAIKERIRGR